MEDFSDDDEYRAILPEQSAANSEYSLQMQTEKHVEVELQRSINRHERFRVVVPHCTPNDRGPRRKFGVSSFDSRINNCSIALSSEKSIGSYKCKYNLPDACSLSSSI